MKICENCPRTKPLCVSCSMSECNITKKVLYQQICDTLQILYSKNYYLIEHEVNEVCLSTHFWHYFKLEPVHIKVLQFLRKHIIINV